MFRRPFTRLGFTALAVVVLGATMAPSALAVAPPGPEGASAYPLPTGARVSWSPVVSEDLSHYMVKADVGTTPPSDPSGGVPVDSFSSEVDLFLSNDTEYAISVFACDAESSCSAPATTGVTTPSTAAPFPTDVIPTDTTVDIYYSYAGAPSGYRIAVAPDTQTPPTDPFDPTFTWVDDAASPVTVTGLAQSTSYYIYLYPMFGPGWGAQGFGFVTTTAPVPAAATALTAQSRPNGGVALSWTPPANTDNLNSYEMRYRSGVPPVTVNEGSVGPSAAANATGMTFEPLTPGTNYGISIFACNSSLACSAPVGVSFTGRSDAYPTVSVGTVSHNTAAMTYSTIPGASSYRIGRGPDTADYPTGPTDADFVWATDAASPFTLTGLSASTDYVVHVIPIFSDNGWGNTGSAWFGTNAAPPPPATGLTATLSSTGTVRLNWTSVSSPSGGWSIIGHNGPTDTLQRPCPNTTATCFNLGGVVGSARTFTVTAAQIGISRPGAGGYGTKWYFGVTPLGSGGVAGTMAKVATIPWAASKLAPNDLWSTASFSGGSYRLKLDWTYPLQPNWTHLKVYFAAGSTAPSDTQGLTPVYSCAKSTGCLKTFTKAGLTNGAKYSYSVYAYVTGTSPLQKSRNFGTNTARAPGVVINGAWVPGTLPPHYFGEVELAFDSTGVRHLVYPREDGLYYARRTAGAGGTWGSSVKITGTSGTDNYAELVILSNNTLVLGFNRVGVGPYLTTRAVGAAAWATPARIGATTPAAGLQPYIFRNLVRDSANGLHVLLSRSTYPYSTSKTTDGIFYLKRPVTAAPSWSALTKVPGTTAFDFGLLTIDNTRTKLGMTFGRAGHPTASADGVYAAVKSPAAGNFPTPGKIVTSPVGTDDYPSEMTMHGARVQVFFSRSTYPAKTTDGVYFRSGVLGGTAATPTVTWPAAAARVGGTNATDFICGIAVNPSNGETAMCLSRGPYGSPTAGMYLLKSTTAGAWGGTPAVKKTGAEYDFVSDVEYYANVVYFTWLRH